MSKLSEIKPSLWREKTDLKVRQIEILSIPPTGVGQSIEKLAAKYEAMLTVVWLYLSNTYKLVANKLSQNSCVLILNRRLIKSLSRAALETLSIVYKQPIAGEIDGIRRVNSWQGHLPSYCCLSWFEKMVRRSLVDLIFM